MRNKHGFTLVELLVAVTVLAILASLVLVGLASATQSAKEARTRATIAKINAVVMAKWESYATRRVPVHVPQHEMNGTTWTDHNGNGRVDGVPEQYTDANNNGRYDLGESFDDQNGDGEWSRINFPVWRANDIAKRRLDVLREIMRMEMPDRFSDISDNPVTPSSLSLAVSSPPISRPSVSSGYKTELESVSSPSTQYQGAKCLYLLVTRGCDDPDIMEQFAAYEIGTDADGMKYFKDGWENPIAFLRWAPGFVSSLQTNPPSSHDPFDPIHTYPNTFLLYPLIYSAGPDGEYEVNTAGSHRYSTNGNNPFKLSGADAIGVWTDTNGDGLEGHIDNINNHD